MRFLHFILKKNKKKEKKKENEKKRECGRQGEVPKFIFIPKFQEDLEALSMSEQQTYHGNSILFDTFEDNMEVLESKDVHFESFENGSKVVASPLSSSKRPNPIISSSTSNTQVTIIQLQEIFSDPKTSKPISNSLDDATATMNSSFGCILNEDSRSDILHHYICYFRWAEAIEKLQKDVTLSQHWKQVHNCCGKVMQSNLPIHLALKFQAHEDLIVALVDAYPEALTLTDEKGRTPLHLACLLKTKSALSVVNYLLDRYPGAAKHRDNRSKVPLHLALKFQAHEDIIMTLINAYPEALKLADGKGRMPLHLACFLKTKSALPVVNYLLDRYPEAVKCRDIRGKIPLHLAYFRKHFSDDDHIAVIKKLISMDPASVFIDGDEGNILHHE